MTTVLWMWVAALSARQEAPSPSPPDIAALVACTEIAFSNAAERRDRDGFKTFLHPDARFITARVSRGPNAIVSAWSPFFRPDGPSIRWRPETVEVAVDGDIALSRGPYRIVTAGADGERQEQWGHFISIWRRSGNDTWRVQFDTGGDVGMQPTEAQRQLVEQSADDAKCSDLAHDGAAQ